MLCQHESASRPDASAHLAVAHQFVDAGYDHLALINAGPEPEDFFGFFASELVKPLRKLTPSAAELIACRT